MKNLMSSSTIVILIAILSIFSSCKPDSIQDLENTVNPEDYAAPQMEYPHFHTELCNHTKSLDFDLENPEKIDFEFPDGTTEERYLIEGDIVVTREELEELKKDNGRQYRTYNLVASPRTIKVVGYTGYGYDLTEKMKKSLTWAINNYNHRINTGLNFTLTFGTDYDDADIVVYRYRNGKAGGSAGFPSNGNPFKWVQIFENMENYNNNVIEHVIGHEIGHCLGLRHTDWATRVSCGGGGESAGSEGAVHIPGTPTGIDWNSQMMACFDGTEDGELSQYDINALQYLY